jgi:TIGR03009 family protein
MRTIPRLIAMTLVTTLLGVVVLRAQVPAQPGQTPTAPNPDAAKRLDVVLGYWEQVMTSVEKLEADCKRARLSKRFNTVEHYEGKAQFYKTPTPPSRASLDLRRKDNPAIVEKLILNDVGLWEYDVGAKELRLHELPKRAGDAENNLMALLFGMKVPAAKARYDIQLKGEDQYYFYLEIVPRTEADKAEFAKARLTLVRATYLPAQLWFQQANQDEVQWDLSRVNPQANHLRPADFASPQTPPGWKLTRVPSAAPPKIRSAGN